MGTDVEKKEPPVPIALSVTVLLLLTRQLIYIRRSRLLTEVMY